MTASAASSSSLRTWFITGVSSGFGRALAQEALAAGHRVVGTLRNEAARAAFDALQPGRSFGRLLDVTHGAEVLRVVAEVEATVGPIDVLVNNAGYGHEGTVEESSLDDLRQQFEVNVFGAVAMAKAVLPFMRARRRGHILNITSMGGIVTFPGLGYYHGSKFALEGISETLGKEVASFGIHVTAVEPGGFRTDWAGRSMVRAPQTIDDYAPVMGPVREARLARSGKQAGDPAKAARAMLQLTEAANPPAHLLLGPDAVKVVREKLGALQEEIKAWEAVSVSTDFTP
ncbi:oxidoreductase [Variovorax sp. J22G73]|uniref:oxidoreductase n=1 Tax=unclassified Variovorax TaxID=663243 RepID=UPI000D5FD783|nr:MULTISPECIES: oxidoreductase [unclassified Variovorax]MDM0009159.1 oxidoreductase [Variovorax sp. J22R203]MDM0101666.1 oxidoreductase [Variovorax sp. J22G73]